MPDSSQPHGLQPARLLCPWNSTGKIPGVGCHFLLQGIFPTQGSCIARQSLPPEPPGNPIAAAAKLHPTLCDPMDCSLLGSSVHGILQARILESVAVPFSRGFSQPGLEPTSPTLLVDSSLSEPPGKPKNTEVSSLVLLQGIFPTQFYPHCRQTC